MGNFGPCDRFNLQTELKFWGEQQEIKVHIIYWRFYLRIHHELARGGRIILKSKMFSIIF